MKQVVFPQKKVVSMLKKNFVPIVLDVKDDVLPKGFDFIGVPTFYVIDENGKKIGVVLGGMSEEKFLKTFDISKGK